MPLNDETLKEYIHDLNEYKSASIYLDKLKKEYPLLVKTKDMPDVFVTDNIKVVRAITKALTTDPHCPCVIIKNDDTLCMCQDFMNQKEGYCHCGLYYKELYYKKGVDYK